ncbi:UDP-N-acetylglucosamine--N-acetylglucosamine transferase [Carbonactinospora thermoautotrophica]|uniref:MGDG synthase family glycosyltransferase n=1 Tax=Carbonactinospora thermoautotrophica TaxID=1469144 RepID=UPI00226D4BAE|nr:glycosyltransferase [Carbonactinospora thermoautotrophica]MCX9190611.1 UDP-N-acetylglucosamine--N-acetylglucosamine transferase [Carbonactinospora thermoautotrophica]
MSRSDDPESWRAPHPGSARAGVRDHVVVISGSVGAGHDGAARELERRLRALGFQVECHDFLDLLPSQVGRLFKGAYKGMLAEAPWSWQALYGLLDRSRTLTGLVRGLAGIARPRVRALIRKETCLAVATYPLAGQVLGQLRQRGEVAVPVAMYFTDFSVHRLWVSRYVDVHLAPHAVSAEEARALGAPAVVVAGPLVRPGFAPPTRAGRQAARARFGLPFDRRLALVASGSWGVGDVARTVAEIASTGLADPVVVCGRNEQLRRELAGQGIGHVFGWVDDMPALMRAVDVMVQNGCGLTVLEAFASGLPVATYRCIPGHGRTNAAAWDRAGLATWIRQPEELPGALAELLDGPLRHRQVTAAGDLFSRDPVALATRLAQPVLPALLARATPLPARVGMAGARLALLLSGAGAGVVAYGSGEVRPRADGVVFPVPHPRAGVPDGGAPTAQDSGVSAWRLKDIDLVDPRPVPPRTRQDGDAEARLAEGVSGTT